MIDHFCPKLYFFSVAALMISGCGEDPDSLIDKDGMLPADMSVQSEVLNPSLSVVPTWDYGVCTDAKSLIPPPMEGWRLLNDTPRDGFVMTADNARIVFTYEDPKLEVGSNASAASKQTAMIYVQSDNGTAEALAEILQDDDRRSRYFEAGPYNYPVMVTGQGTLLGRYHVYVDGIGGGKDRYFSQMIECAIENGLVANGIDPASLVSNRN